MYNSYARINCIKSIKLAISNYINFSGRTRRSEFWYFVVLVNIITILFICLTIYYFDDYEIVYYDRYNYYRSRINKLNGQITMVILDSIYFPFVILPLFSSTVRRLHDIGKRGEYIFIGLVPFYGQLALLILLCKDSEKQPNEYGPSPKYVSMEDTPIGQINNTDYLNPNSLI